MDKLTEALGIPNISTTILVFNLNQWTQAYGNVEKILRSVPEVVGSDDPIQKMGRQLTASLEKSLTLITDDIDRELSRREEKKHENDFLRNLVNDTKTFLSREHVPKEEASRIVEDFNKRVTAVLKNFEPNVSQRNEGLELAEELAKLAVNVQMKYPELTEIPRGYI